MQPIPRATRPSTHAERIIAVQPLKREEMQVCQYSYHLFGVLYIDSYTPIFGEIVLVRSGFGLRERPAWLLRKLHQWLGRACWNLWCDSKFFDDSTAILLAEHDLVLPSRVAPCPTLTGESGIPAARVE